MAIFPTLYSQGFGSVEPLVVELVAGKTLISNFNDLGEEKRRSKWIYPRRNVQIQFRGVQIQDAGASAKVLTDFYQARKGSFEAFNFFYPFTNTYEGEYVGTGDSATLGFNLPSKAGESFTVYVDSVAQADGSDYDFSGEVGTDGADRINFQIAPVSGERITYDFTGTLKIRARFMEDGLSYVDFFNQLIITGVNLKGLLNE